MMKVICKIIIKEKYGVISILDRIVNENEKIINDQNINRCDQDRCDRTVWWGVPCGFSHGSCENESCSIVLFGVARPRPSIRICSEQSDQ
jgi:hypothetical protein